MWAKVMMYPLNKLDISFVFHIKNRDEDMVNEAKAINSLLNILRKQPSVDNWNGLLRDQGFPINTLVLP